MGKCKKCGCGTRISSHGVQNANTGCIDVCVNPICADPNVLSIMAPLIYDEIGINLCTTFPLGTDIITTYPTAVNATAQVIDISYDYGEGNVMIENIPNRPNCYLVTLSNLTVTFAINLYDSACRLVGTLYPTAIYLPPLITAPTYDEDTNPTSVALEIFAPYGLSYTTGGEEPVPVLNYIGFSDTNNFVRQGINLLGIPKVLNFDSVEGTVTIGLTLILQSLYFAGYHVASAGKICTPKGSLIAPEDSDCMNFVSGDLLNLSIKPLELGAPNCEENYKKDCSTGCGGCTSNSSSSCGNCSTNTTSTCGNCQSVDTSMDFSKLLDSDMD